MKKLVEIDPDRMITKEFDNVKIQRSAQSLKLYLEALSEEESFGLRKHILPIVEAALGGTLVLPFDVRTKPLSWESTEGLLPHEYRKLAAPFFVAIAGMSGLGQDLIVPTVIDGRSYAWMEFEE